MPSAEAHVETARASRYLAQLCQHASKMGRPRHRPRMHIGGGTPPGIQRAEWSATEGALVLDWGRCTLHASADALTLRASAPDEENLSRIQDLLTARLESFGRREQLKVTWQPREYTAGV